MINDSIEKIISQYEKQHQVIEKSIVDVIWVVDIEDMCFTYISPSIEAISGYTTDEVSRPDLLEKMASQSVGRAMEILTEAHRKFKLGKNVKRKAEFSLTHKDGSTFWVEITAKFFKDENDRTQLFGIMRNISKQHALRMERDRLLLELETAISHQQALEAENQMLRGLLPICSGCKKIRDDDGNWWNIEEYVAEHAEVDFSHTICPPCRKIIYPEID